MAATTKDQNTSAAEEQKDARLRRPSHGSPQAALKQFKSEAFGTHVQALMGEWHTPGLAAAIVHDQTIASRAWGLATLDPPRKCTPDTLFDIASSSKSMTAASVALLVEDEENYPNVKWDSVMNTLLPNDFVMNKDEYTKEVTIDDILSHRSGLPSHDSSYLGLKATHPDNARSVTRNLRNLPLAAPVRMKYMYCNMMFTAATHLIETLTSLPFADFLHKHFFGPLNMSSTHLQPSAMRRAGLQERAALPYDWVKDTKEFRPLAPEEAPEAQGAGSIYTSVNDYILYVKAIINREGPITQGVYDGVTRLRAFSDPGAEQREDTEPYTSAEAYAAGWEVSWYRGYQVVKHYGGIPGFASLHFFMPEFRFGGVLMTNSDEGADAVTVLAKELIDEMLGVPEVERVDWNARLRALDEKRQSEGKGEKERLTKEICADGDGDEKGTLQPQKLPLRVYTGEYWNAGYHGMKVEAREEKLFVDGFDRSYNGLALTFEHICEQTQYIVEVRVGGQDATEWIRGEFRFENDKVVKMGLQLEVDLPDMIWFDRVLQGSSAVMASR